MQKIARRFAFSFSIFIFCVLTLISQHANGQKLRGADTTLLLAQLARHTTNDTGKVVLQCKFAMAKWYASGYDIRVLQEITVYKMQALALSIRLSWYKGIDMSRKILGGTFEMGGNQAATKELLTQIVRYTTALTDDDLKNKCSLDISEIYLAMDNLKEARNYYDKGFNYFVEHKNAAELLLYLRIDDSRKLIDDEKYNAMGLRAIDIARAASDDKTLTTCYDLLAHEQQTAQHSDEALRYYQLEGALLAKAGNYAGLSLSLRNIGAIYEARSNRDVALTYYLKAAAAAEKRITAKNWDYLEEYYVVIAGCYEGMHNYRDAEKYLRIAIARSSLPEETAEAWRALSGYYVDRADYVKAIEADEKAREYFAKGGEQTGVGVSYKEIGDIFALTGNIDAALANYQKGFDVYMGQHNPAWPPTILTSMGLLYLREQPEKAMQYFNRAIALSKSFHDDIFDPQINAAISTAFFNEKNYGRAFAYAHFSLNDTASSNYFNTRARAALYRVIGKVVRDAPDTLLLNHGIKPADRYKTTIAYLNKSKALMDNAVGETEALRDEAEDFYITYDQQKDYAGAYAPYRQYVTLRDSIANRQQVSAFEQREENLVFSKRADSLKSIQLLTQSELEKQQLALRLNNQQLDLANKDKAIQHAGFVQTQTNLKAEQSRRKANEAQLKATRADDALQKNEINNKRVQSYYLYGGIAALLFVSFFIARNYFNQKRSNVLLSNANNQIIKEKQRSDDLLLNILPADVAEELKEKGSSDARLFDEVTVLFTDFVSFTTVSELLSPQELVNELNVCFKAFDGIMTIHNIEKIKTVGDAYLAVSGLPNADANHAANVINAAQDIQQFMLQRKLLMGDKTFGIRLGVNSGSVVAGIVGVKKFAYDIWGDTVNTAARMEQNSEPGKINVSEKTYELVKDQFAFTCRGEIAAKNKGMMKMYFAESTTLI